MIKLRGQLGSPDISWHRLSISLVPNKSCLKLTPSSQRSPFFTSPFPSPGNQYSVYSLTAWILAGLQRMLPQPVSALVSLVPSVLLITPSQLVQVITAPPCPCQSPLLGEDTCPTWSLILQSIDQTYHGTSGLLLFPATVDAYNYSSGLHAPCRLLFDHAGSSPPTPNRHGITCLFVLCDRTKLLPCHNLNMISYKTQPIEIFLNPNPNIKMCMQVNTLLPRI